MQEKDPGTIRGYHAHVYYDDPNARAEAGRIREQLGALFDVKLGRWRDDPVGPHPTPMYQVAFAASQFPLVVPWLMLNRGNLTVLVHPETGDDPADHSDHALWLGEILDLDIESLRKPQDNATG